MTTHFVYSEEFHNHDQPGHPENAQRLTTMITELKKTPLYEQLTLIDPTLISEKTLYELHSEDMIEIVKDYSKIGDAWIDLDTYVSLGDYHTARLAAGGLSLLCQNIMDNKVENGFALVRPPGHHATRTRSMGFCLFNNTALAAHELTKQHKKILVFDNDIHHGNGTQDIFYDRNDVLYQSLHLTPHFPGTGDAAEIGTEKGEGYTNNAPLHYGNGNTAAEEILQAIFLPIARQFKPDLIIISTGFDAHHKDLLGGLRYTIPFFQKMIELYQDIQPKIAITLEGGYNHEWIGKCLIAELATLTHHTVHYEDYTQEDTAVEPLKKRLNNILASYWKL